MPSDVAGNIATAMALKEEGNTHFKAGDYQQAIVAYHQIFMYVHGYSQGGGGGASSMMPGKTTTPVTDEEAVQIRDLKIAHFCNLAMCHMKHGPKYHKARDLCTKALQIDPDNVKARFRRGKCYAQLGAIDEAKADLERVLELQPDNKDAMRELRALKGAFDKHRKKEQRKFAGMFDRMQDDEAADAAVVTAAADPTAATAGASPSKVEHTDKMLDAAALGDAAAGGEDIGERIGEVTPFEPQDVHYAEGEGV